MQFPDTAATHLTEKLMNEWRGRNPEYETSEHNRVFSSIWELLTEFEDDNCSAERSAEILNEVGEFLGFTLVEACDHRAPPPAHEYVITDPYAALRPNAKPYDPRVKVTSKYNQEKLRKAGATGWRPS